MHYGLGSSCWCDVVATATAVDGVTVVVAIWLWPKMKNKTHNTQHTALREKTTPNTDEMKFSAR